ncbi:hypothetical protein [Faecalibacterium prausnitzii]|uniref:hypothetical protein n=1 Tax=Faecalibacterium prausnitzii TaxID=853 RepID=UPI0015EC866D|nr:hypothetical protein [Faecalibacterium prausnitzii]
MKQFRRFLWALLLIGMAIAIYSSAVGETAPEKINWGGAEPAAGSWARTADAMEFSCPHGRGEGRTYHPPPLRMAEVSGPCGRECRLYGFQ